MERATDSSLKGHTPFLVIYRRNFLASWLRLVFRFVQVCGFSARSTTGQFKENCGVGFEARYRLVI